MTRLTGLSHSIEGKVTMVTGAASGIGGGTADLFADEGAAVVVTTANAPADLPDDAQVRANDYVVDFEHRQRQKIRVLGFPCGSARRRASCERPHRSWYNTPKRSSSTYCAMTGSASRPCGNGA